MPNGTASNVTPKQPTATQQAMQAAVEIDQLMQSAVLFFSNGKETGLTEGARVMVRNGWNLIHNRLAELNRIESAADSGDVPETAPRAPEADSAKNQMPENVKPLQIPRMPKKGK